MNILGDDVYELNCWCPWCEIYYSLPSTMCIHILAAVFTDAEVHDEEVEEVEEWEDLEEGDEDE